jgi:hypothetical protein
MNVDTSIRPQAPPNTSVPASINENSINHATNSVKVPSLTTTVGSTDLAKSIPGMYRILDLITERGGSGGLGAEHDRPTIPY